MRKIISIILLICMSMMFITSCKLSINKDEKKIAASNAVEYIEEKYGFTPKVKSVDSQTVSGSIFPSVSRYALVTMSYKGDEFEVYAKWGEETIDETYDNYQLDEFKEELTEVVASKIDCIDYQINVEIPYLDITVTNYDELIESDYNVLIDVMTYGLTYNSYHQLYNYFLGEHFSFILRDYRENNFPSWDDVTTNFISSSEYLDLHYTVEFSYQKEERHEYEIQKLDGFTAVYDTSEEISFENIEMDYSFIETHSNYGYEYPFGSYHISGRPDSKVYLYFSPDVPTDGHTSYIFDGWLQYSDNSTIRDTSIKIDNGPYEGYQVIVLRIDGREFDFGVVKRSYTV